MSIRPPNTWVSNLALLANNKTVTQLTYIHRSWQLQTQGKTQWGISLRRKTHSSKVSALRELKLWQASNSKYKAQMASQFKRWLKVGHRSLVRRDQDLILQGRRCSNSWMIRERKCLNWSRQLSMQLDAHLTRRLPPRRRQITLRSSKTSQPLNLRFNNYSSQSTTIRT